MIVTLFGYLITDEFIRRLSRTKVAFDLESIGNQDVKDLIDDDSIKNILERTIESTSVFDTD